ncbi:MAG: pantoate--beta-alanine ligase [Verrucomicrobia bacterium]|jgi:pantoate--beta-alanine ligase|nr:pantoate--beta-alanine ligase [Verrucomicrobiota bacterium]OQC66300.1 MAG: Pantothenate synthetase [Verrucomicrobia bacterium ADurb.Bin006]MDI9382111.1 pantoate--beta-alanine ligase [Verrucomicrobiota bacterium]NMD20027.1 pantoate--beta-alanine ligase [Verrucomicrobiota bacterium]HNU99132.1 pantoate--beta-alanine ligase [Verrucomicrobiota bacterium]
MRIVVALHEMQRLARRWRRQGVRVAFVPTMGALHTGHLSLVQEARRRVKSSGRVVVSVFVNPTQFAPHEDLAAYPRNLARDRALCRTSGVDVLFVPEDTAMYPQAPVPPSSTCVVEEALTRSMEGSARPTHFRGVTTVLAKLFNLVLPDLAIFGAKDWQQAAVVRRMVRDLNFPLQIVVAPTVRESDGLAMSSRNQRLAPDERPQATVLWRSIQWARGRVQAARRAVPAAQLQKGVAKLVASEPAARLDYVAFFDPDTLEPTRAVHRTSHMALAVFVGKVRLIDNAPLGVDAP